MSNSTSSIKKLFTSVDEFLFSGPYADQPRKREIGIITEITPVSDNFGYGPETRNTEDFAALTVQIPDGRKLEIHTAYHWGKLLEYRSEIPIWYKEHKHDSDELHGYIDFERLSAKFSLNW